LKELVPNKYKATRLLMEWPPKSGQTQAFPEIDRAQWFLLTEAKSRINPAQAAFLKRLLDHLDRKL
jgi:predicted NUDIX family NTP pyrophosphohydrolase